MKRIPLTQGKYALIDDEDFERVAQFKWSAHRGSHSGDRWYAVRNAYVKGERVWVRMHRFLMDLPPGAIDGLIVDHKDNDGLNNRRKSNLEVVTIAENTRRARARKRAEPYL